MAEQSQLQESIAETIADYRLGEIEQRTPDHVERWISQFTKDARVPILRELNHVLEKTYFKEERIVNFLDGLIKNEGLTGGNNCGYWKDVHFLNIQQNGHSQEEMLRLFDGCFQSNCGSKLADCNGSNGEYIYLDDVLFSGFRSGDDLSTWIRDDAPGLAALVMIFLATYKLGEYQCLERLKKLAREMEKEINITCWRVFNFENRRRYRNNSDVLWPAIIPDNKTVNAYIEGEEDHPFIPRADVDRDNHPVFSSEEGRRLLEREFLLAGVRIRSFCKEPKRNMRPLGFSVFGLGFGSLIITYRNCPNNCPLALWWGDPSQSPSHPLSKWFPLVPRRGYEEEP